MNKKIIPYLIIIGICLILLNLANLGNLSNVKYKVYAVKLNKGNLINSINKAKLYTKKYYEINSYKQLENNLTNAISVYNKQKSTKKEIDFATYNLNMAMQKIILVPIKVNKSDLLKTIKLAQTYTKVYYNQQSFNELTNAKNIAISINENQNYVSQYQVDKVTNNLKIKINKMKLIVKTREDLTPVLKKSFQIANFPGEFKISLKDKYGTLFTNTSVEKLKDILPEVIQVYTDHNSSSLKITQAYVSLTKAVNGLIISKGPYYFEQQTPIKMTVNQFKADYYSLMMPKVFGVNGMIQKGTINWNPKVTIVIDNKIYDLNKDFTKALAALKNGKYTLTYNLNSGNQKNPILLKPTRVLNIISENTKISNKPYYFKDNIKNNEHYNNLYSLLPYKMINQTPLLYNNKDNVVDVKNYKIDYKILIGNEENDLFNSSVNYRLPATYKIKYTAYASGTGKILATMVKYINNDNKNKPLINYSEKYWFRGVNDAVLSKSDFKNITKKGDIGDVSFDPFYNVVLVNDKHQIVQNYDTVTVYSNWNTIINQSIHLTPVGNYKINYYATRENGEIISQATRNIKIIK